MSQQRCQQRTSGFTLIEVMIVVVIIGIIAAIAYPAYTRHVQDTRMATAQADLMELAQWMERQYSLNNSFTGLTTGNLPFSASPKDGNTTAYNLTLGNVTANTYTLTATPTGPQVGHGCGTLTLNQAGARTPDPATNPNCWR